MESVEKLRPGEEHTPYTAGVPQSLWGRDSGEYNHGIKQTNFANSNRGR